MLDTVFAIPRRWWSRLDRDSRRDVLVFVLLLFAYGFFQQRVAWNENSRYDLVRAIVEQGTLRIDDYHENTGDKAFYDGHWYSDKAPGTALLGVPVYALLRLPSAITGAEPPAGPESIEGLAFVESALPTALLVILLMRFLRPVVGQRWSVVVGLAYGFGSIAFPFATMFFGHAASTAALFAAFFLLQRLRHRPDRWSALGAGFLAGWGVLIEMPVVIGVAALLVYALLIGRGTALRFVVGGLPLAAVLGLHNAAAFGSPTSFGYEHLLPGQFASGMSEGIFGVSWPDADTAGDLLFGPRGLISLAPWFALAPLGLLAVRWAAVRAEVILCATLAGLFLIYNAGYYLPFGGWTPGPRFLLPALPFAAVLVALAPARLRLVAIPLMLVGGATMFVATTTMPNAPERYADPLLDLWLPRFVAGDLAATVAQLRWDLPAVASLAILVLGMVFGLVALAMSFGRPQLADRVAVRAPVALAVLTLAFAFPFPPPGPLLP